MNQICPKTWILSKSFVKTVFYYKVSHKEISQISKYLLQNMTKIYYKVFITKIYYKVWHEVITKCDKCYKVWQLLHRETFHRPKLNLPKDPFFKCFFNGLVIAFWYGRVCEQLSLHILIGSTNSMHRSEKET